MNIPIEIVDKIIMAQRPEFEFVDELNRLSMYHYCNSYFRTENISFQNMMFTYYMQ